MSTVQTVVVTVAVSAAAYAGYKYVQRKRAEARLKKALGGFADEMEKIFGVPPGWSEQSFTGFNR
jgi:hypothetical protein